MLLFKGRVFPALIVGLDREKNSEHEQHHFQRNFQIAIVSGPAIVLRTVVSLSFAEDVEFCQVSVIVGKSFPFYEVLFFFIIASSHFLKRLSSSMIFSVMPSIPVMML